MLQSNSSKRNGKIQPIRAKKIRNWNLKNEGGVRRKRKRNVKEIGKIITWVEIKRRRGIRIKKIEK